MTDSKTNTPTAFKIALLNLAVGTIGLISTLLFSSVSKGIGEISIGLILLGLGEYVNNPRYTPANTKNMSQTKPSNVSIRRRSISSLGNLLDIAGVLMLSIGAGTLIL